MILLSFSPTAALAAQVTPAVALNGSPRNLVMQANFTYGSGGTSFDAWVQTSLDNGLTWTDIANFNFLLASARKLYNLSALTAKTTVVAPTDGTLTANTAVDGILGPQYRVKWTSVGIYAATTVRVDIHGDQIQSYP